MKINLDGLELNNIILDLIDMVVAWAMKKIIEDDTHYQHPDDVAYYETLKVAAAYIHNHLSEPDDHYEIEEWPE